MFDRPLGALFINILSNARYTSGVLYKYRGCNELTLCLFYVSDDDSTIRCKTLF